MHSPVKLTPTLACMLVWMAVAPGGARAETPREVLGRVLAEAAHEAGGSLSFEDPLDRVAKRISEVALDGTGSPLVHQQIAWAEGLRDVSLHPLTLVAEELPPAVALRAMLGTAPIDWSATRFAGAGVTRGDGRVAATFLLVQRSAIFGAETVLLPAETTEARLMVTNPLGQVERRALVPAGDPGRFRRDESIQALPGTWLFELERITPRGPELLALWPVSGEDAPPSSDASTTDTLGLGPGGLGATEETLRATGGLGWTRGGDAPPDRPPRVHDAEAVERHLRAVLLARRRAAGLSRLDVHAGVTAVARSRSGSELDGPAETRPAAARLLDAGITPLSVDEIVVVAPDPIVGWALLMAEPGTRALILRSGVASFGLGAGIHSNGQRWSVALTLLRAELGAEGATWPAVVRAHLGRARQEAGLGALYPRAPLDALAAAAADEIAALGVASMSEARRGQLVADTRALVPDSVSVGIDVLVTRDPSAVAGVAHVTERRFAELGVGVVEVPDSDAGFAIVLVLVQR
jgi:hypothetical protein